MKTLVQLLIISTAALTRVMTTKAKTEGMITQSQNLSDDDDPAPYENPWTKDQADGKCNAGEMFNYFIKEDGVKVGQCMLQIKNNQHCIMPLPNADNLDGKVLLTSDRIWYCVAECSDPSQKCPLGSTCMPVQKDLQVEGFEVSSYFRL